MQAAIQVLGGTFTMQDSRVTLSGAGPGEDLVMLGDPNLPSARVSATVDRTTISENSLSEGSIVAVYAGATAIVTKATIVHNSVVGSGAAIAAVGRVTVSDTTIADNSFQAGGSGISAAGSTSSVTNSTIVNNSGGVFGAVRVLSSIIAGNTVVGDCGSLASLGYNIIGNPAGCTGLVSSDLTGDPGLGAFIDDGVPGHGRFPLLPGSPAINAGYNVACAVTDQLQTPRLASCDIGAVEFYPVVNDLVSSGT